MAIRTIDAPGIEIHEIDKSQYSPAMTGTKVLVTGFANSGEDYTPMIFTSKSAWLNYYGEPDNEAERYFYAASMEVLNQNGVVNCCKLPYENEACDKFVAMKYTLGGTDSEISTFGEILSGNSEYKDKAISSDACIDDVLRFFIDNSENLSVKFKTFVETEIALTSDSSLSVLDTELSVVDPSLSADEIGEKTFYEQFGGVLSTETALSTAFFNEISKAKLASYLSDDDRKSLFEATMWSEIKEADGTIQKYRKITADSNPMTLDMQLVDEYRTGEKRVAENEILIVDKTRKPYGQIPEDANHKGSERELIGIIPIITTAANALYAQQMIDVADEEIPTYESINDVLTLDGDNDMKSGELSTVAVISKRFNNDHVDGDEADEVFDSLAIDAGGYFPSMPLDASGNIARENIKKIGLVVVKEYLDAGAGNKISFTPVESFVGSLNRDDKNPNTGATTFIDEIVNSQSQYVDIFTNCTVDESTDILVMPHSTANVASMGFYESMMVENIGISESILKGLDLVYDKVSDINERDIDIVVDGGVSNIAQFVKTVYGSTPGKYEPASTNAALWKCERNDDVKMWKTVIQKYDNFCKNIRKDCMFIADGPRPYCLQGQKKIVRASKPTNTIDANILPFTKFLTGINTSYGAGYCDWFQIADEFSGDYFWCPPSVKACGVYIYTDLNFEYWDAPAGLNRGLIAALDVAFSPTNKQAGQIYTKNWNYAVNYPQEGIVLEGQKTFQTLPSAPDRINVRRLMLRLERAVYKVLRYIVYEGNTAYLRQRVVDLIKPYFEEAKIGGGLYDYKIVCDASNNPPETIDRNELHISIGLKPTRSIEFIICNFVLLSTGASWDEM